MRLRILGFTVCSVLLFAVAIRYFFVFTPTPVYAQSCDTSNLSSLNLDALTERKAKCEEAFSQMEAAKKPHVDSLRKMDADISAFQSRIIGIEADLVKKSKAIMIGESQLGDQLTLATKRIRQFYVRSYSSMGSVLMLLTASDIGQAFRMYGYDKNVTNEDKKTIIATALRVKDLEDRKKELEREKVGLSALKADIDAKAASVRKLVTEATAYQKQLSSAIAALSAQQQQLLAQKLASLNISRSANSAGRCDSDLTNGRDPGFSPKFGFFTYGTPNRVGLNQYGAWGRAKQNQDEETILRAYYNFDEIKRWDTNIDIRVDGYGTYKLDEYVKRIYEIPDSWTDNNLAALKAQAIAARSYVLAYTNNGSGSICTTEQCQVFKPEPKGGNWEQAVTQTEGKVMVKGGNPIKAWFSSTHGGYIFSTAEIGWNGTDWTKHANDFVGSVNSFEDLKNNSYDKDSPWFYCDWGSRSQYNKTAWLKPEEVADIVNVLMLAKADSSTQKHLSQTDKTNPDGVETWSADTVKSELRNRGGSPFNTISSVQVEWDKVSGMVTKVLVSGDASSREFGREEFKSYFNLRAPANIQIVGPLFNIEKK